MSDSAYFQSLTQEIHALKNRVRHFIKDRHWLSDGLWKESVLRAVIRRHLPRSLGVGTGFIVKAEDVSTQIDILIFDTTKPILFQDGDFIIVTPDLVRAIIEVKTKIGKSDLIQELERLADNHYFVASTALCQLFVGLFSFDCDNIDYRDLLSSLDATAQGNSRKKIHCVALGENLFTRFWHCPPETPRHPNELWRAYNLPRRSPAYFIHNIIESLCEKSVLDNDSVWFPREGKEQFILGDQLFTKNE